MRMSDYALFGCKRVFMMRSTPKKNLKFSLTNQKSLTVCIPLKYPKLLCKVLVLYLLNKLCIPVHHCDTARGWLAVD